MHMNKVISFSCQEITFLAPFTHTVVQLSLLILINSLYLPYLENTQILCLETCTLQHKFQMGEMQM